MANGFLLKGIVMAVKHLKPTSAGRRWQTISDFSEITCTKPEKSLLEPRNIPKTFIITADEANTYDLVNNNAVLMPADIAAHFGEVLA